MMRTTWVDMPYHQQDKSYYCGAAVAQMMIDDGKSEPDHQDDLYGELNDPAQPWYTAPNLLATFLERRLRGTFAATFEGDSFVACQRLAHALVTAKLAIPAVVLDGQHWVAVTGVTYQGAPDAIDTIEGFYFDDPSPVTAYVLYNGAPGIRSPPLEHRSNDACGRGDRYGFANTYATIGGWLSEYWPQQQRASCITVHRTLLTQTRPLRLGARRPCDDALQGPASTPSDRAMACATAAIVRNAIDREGPLAQQLHGFVASAARYVVGDETTPPYFLVFLKRAGKIVGTATIDALDGALGSVQAARVGPSLPNTGRAHAVAALRAEADRDARFRRFDRFADDDIVVDEALYWRPSRESISRHRPFVRIHAADTTLYQGLDGRFHFTLEPAGA